MAKRKHGFLVGPEAEGKNKLANNEIPSRFYLQLSKSDSGAHT